MHFTLSVRAGVKSVQCFAQAGMGPSSIAAVLVLLAIRDAVVEVDACRCQLSQMGSRDRCFGVNKRQQQLGPIGSLVSGRPARPSFFQRHLCRRASPIDLLNATSNCFGCLNTSSKHCKCAETLSNGVFCYGDDLTYNIHRVGPSYLHFSINLTLPPQFQSAARN